MIDTFLYDHTTPHSSGTAPFAVGVSLERMVQAFLDTHSDPSGTVPFAALYRRFKEQPLSEGIRKLTLLNALIHLGVRFKQLKRGKYLVEGISLR